jgi:hypothetical protein
MFHFPELLTSPKNRTNEIQNGAELIMNGKNLVKAKEHIAKYGEHIAPDKQEAILEQKVILGMTPYEADLAAGSFRYGVQADPKWPRDTDPLRIIYAQSLEPDNSKIFMIFETDTQFTREGKTAFRVDFEQGLAVKISNDING